MAINESIKKAMRRIRKELELDVKLVKTAHQKEKKEPFDVMFYIPSNKCYVSFPMEKNTSDKIKLIIEESIWEDENLVFSWDGELCNSMLIENKIVQ